MADKGTVTAPGANNLAGIVFDQQKQKVYTIDRGTNRLYVYLWDPSGPTLTLEGGTHETLAGVNGYGLALDEINDLLYVASNNTTIRVFDTATWAPAGTITVPHTAVSVAVDAAGGFLYTSTFGGTGIYKHNLTTNTGQTSPTTNGLIGLAVDQSTGKLYSTHGFSGDSLVAWDPSTMPFTQLSSITSNLGDPTGIAIGAVSFNPLNLSKSDLSDPVPTGSNVTYDICYDNAANPNPVNNVTLVDDLPAGADFVSATNGGTYNAGPRQVTWTIGTLAANAPQQCVQLTLKVTAAAGATITNTVTIESDDTPPTTTSEETDVIAKSTPPTPVPALSQWALLLLSGLILFWAVVVIRKENRNS